MDHIEVLKGGRGHIEAAAGEEEEERRPSAQKKERYRYLDAGVIWTIGPAWLGGLVYGGPLFFGPLPRLLVPEHAGTCGPQNVGDEGLIAP